MSSDKNDIEKKVDRLSRKTNLDIMRKEISFDNQLKELDSKIKEISKNNLKDFEKKRKEHFKVLSADFKDPSIERYRQKLNDI